MGIRSTRGFLIELAIVGALAAGIWVQQNTGIAAGYVIVPALMGLVPLYFWNHTRRWGRRRRWQPRMVGQQRRPYDKRARTNGWQQPKERQFPAWAVYAVAAVLMVGTFCAVFFWPSRQPSKTAHITQSEPPAASPFYVPTTKPTIGVSGARSQAPVSSVAAYPSVGEPTHGRFLCNVSSITDGDTLRCSDGTRIRLHAVAARESDETCKPGHPCPSASGASATAQLSQLVSGQTLHCEQTGTSYGRVTAVCWNQQNTEINCAMVNSGTTVVWPKFNAQRAICS
ncbi:thermonuclease family protein [Sphingobium estronivorans]|uniref:thermonuclease family protein n=1 Tax=Sphingobium estronivorans TaxID=1577690 RepID=UPI001238EB0A|nr:thermonuclease family protein [Sphingobium estronivorans]